MGEAADQLVPAGWGQEDQLRLGHRRADLPRALQVDLEQDRPAGGEVVEHRLPRRAVEVAGELGPLEEAVLGHKLLERSRLTKW